MEGLLMSAQVEVNERMATFGLSPVIVRLAFQFIAPQESTVSTYDGDLPPNGFLGAPDTTDSG